MMLGVREKGNPVGAVVGGRRERGKEVERGKRGGGGEGGLEGGVKLRGIFFESVGRIIKV